MSWKTYMGAALGLLAGGAAGFFGGYYFSKNKYRELAEKEISAVKKVYLKHFKQGTPDAPVKGSKKDLATAKTSIAQTATETPQPVEYNKQYHSVRTMNIKEDAAGRNLVGSFRILTPTEFNESEYDAQTLIYYRDKVLTDDDGNVIHNVNEVIGPEALSTFGRYMDDTVYVRDETKRIDYEIVWDTRTYKSTRELSNVVETGADSED